MVLFPEVITDMSSKAICNAHNIVYMYVVPATFACI